MRQSRSEGLKKRRREKHTLVGVAWGALVSLSVGAVIIQTLVSTGDRDPVIRRQVPRLLIQSGVRRPDLERTIVGRARTRVQSELGAMKKDGS